MANAQATVVGRVGSMRRYPIKSMIGEELDVAEVTERGLRGDRAYALVDLETGKVASAKNPRRWPNLFEFRAAIVGPSGDASSPPPVRITLPGGDVLTTDQADVDARLSDAVGRPVRLARSAFEGAIAEGYWPDHEWLPAPDEAFEFEFPPGSFFDGAMIHLITTATLNRFQALAPDSRFDVRRFRPNLVIEPAEGIDGFAEHAWIGRTLQIGAVLLRIDSPCPRCVMTTLPQADLPKDPAILRTIVQKNAGNAGVYASIVQAGTTAVGDAVSLL
ncbi:MOSC domain-containing protein [Paludisphaera borealis]|uniref:MOSC domain-containing protein n=1 Tax=Paludisphaera borealis TaxID=1387353 RepID=A0A1U7CU01_9BACT|nr:MOSC N-terminal beta barrel domain-containing protein [Paludisphaera borealis]APW62388.1 hypothetical protein BSF38_03927 [Paludisphaera borealis]